MKTSEKRGREAEVSPAVLADLQDALTLDFDAGRPRPLAALCRALVPDLDEMPLKRPLRPADIPLPDRASQRPRPSSPQPPAKKPRRNAPCWCGSGKKYKHCHLHQDKEEERKRRSRGQEKR